MPPEPNAWVALRREEKTARKAKQMKSFGSAASLGPSSRSLKAHCIASALSFYLLFILSDFPTSQVAVGCRCPWAEALSINLYLFCSKLECGVASSMPFSLWIVVLIAEKFFSGSE